MTWSQERHDAAREHCWAELSTDFMAASHVDLPAALDEIERLRVVLSRTEQERDYWRESEFNIGKVANDEFERLRAEARAALESALNPKEN